MESHSHMSQKQEFVSARKLAAMLWEMNSYNNITPSSLPTLKQKNYSTLKKKNQKDILRATCSLHSDECLLSHPFSSPTPVSEGMDRSAETCNGHRRSPSISNYRRLRLTDNHVGPLDSLSNVSPNMEIETRSQAHTLASSMIDIKTRLKDVKNSLTASKELLKIINCIWSDEVRPSTCLSTLHTELERARLQVDNLIQEQHSYKNEITYLKKCLADEKAAWKSKEQETVEATIESIAAEHEVERKLRRSFESLNEKLGRELAETKASLLKVVKELEREKRAREIIEQVCYELAREAKASKGKYEKEKLKIKRESIKVYEEAEKEKEIMQLAKTLRKERPQVKLCKAKYTGFETSLGNIQVRERGCRTTHSSDEEIASCLSRTRFGYHCNEDKEDVSEVEYQLECEDDSTESYLQCTELNMDRNKSRSFNWGHLYESSFDSRMYPTEEEAKGRRSISGRFSTRSTSLQTKENI